MSRGVTVFKNSVILLAAEPFKRVLSLITFGLVARHLGVEHLGIFSLAGAIMAIMGVFVAFGTTAHLTREIARDKTSAAQLAGDVLVARTITFVGGLAVTWIFTVLMGYDPLPVQVILIVAVGLLFVQWEDACVACFDGFQRMELAAVSSVIKAAALLAAALVTTTQDWDVRALAALYNVGYLISFGVSFYLVRRHLTRVVIRPRASVVWTTLKAGWRFLLINALWIITFRVDAVMLSIPAIAGPVEPQKAMGLYAAAYKLFEVLIFLPIVFGRALFPAFSEQVGHADRAGMRRLYGKALGSLSIFAIPICAGVALLSRPFVVVFAGPDYADAGLTLAVFGAMLWMWFVSTTAGWALTALDRLRLIFRANLAATIVNIVANALLIPRYSYNGAAIATGASELILVVVYVAALRREMGVFALRVIPLRPLVATAAMGGFIYGMKQALSGWSDPALLGAVVPSAAVVYLVALALIGGFGEPEKEMGRRLLGRIRRR